MVTYADIVKYSRPRVVRRPGFVKSMEFFNRKLWLQPPQPDRATWNTDIFGLRSKKQSKMSFGGTCTCGKKDLLWPSQN